MLYDLYQRPVLTISIIFIVLIWNLIWQGLALWHAARNKHQGWFIINLIFNTVGILPIVYLVLHREKKTTPTITTLEIQEKKPVAKKRKQKT